MTHNMNFLLYMLSNVVALAGLILVLFATADSKMSLVDVLLFFVGLAMFVAGFCAGAYLINI